MFLIYQDLPMKERETALSNQAVKKEVRNYSRSLQQSEIDLEKTRLANDMMESKQLEENISNLKKEYSDRIKNVEARMDERLNKIRTGKADISGTVYGIPNHATKKMMFYDKFGELIESRDLLPEEYQGRLFIPEKSANAALTDLPKETQAIIEQINEERNADVQDAIVVEDMATNNEVGESLPPEQLDANYLKGISHDEDGWASMSDNQLMKKYGTADMAVIRTMKFMFGKWVAPKKPKDGQEAQQSTVIETPEEAAAREAKFAANAKRNVKK